MNANPPGYDDEKIHFYDVRIEIFRKARNKRPQGALAITGRCELCTGTIAGIKRYDSEKIDMTDELAKIEALASMRTEHQCPQKESRWFEGVADPQVIRAIGNNPGNIAAAKKFFQVQQKGGKA